MRPLNGNAIDALESRAAGIAMFMEAIFDDGELRVNTSRSNIADPNSPAEIYYGIGTIGQIAAVSDEVRGTSGLEITVSGVDVAIISIALGQSVRGKSITFYLGVFNASTWVMLDMVQLWAGVISTMGISETEGLATIKITAEHRGVSFARGKPDRYTDADQQKRYPGDRCLEFLPKQSQVQDVWPAASYFKK